MKALSKMTNWTLRAKKWRGMTKKFGCLPLSDSFRGHESWRIQKLEKGEDSVSVPSSFITIVHNNIYAFNAGKGGFLKKNLSQWKTAMHTAPFEFANAK